MTQASRTNVGKIEWSEFREFVDTFRNESDRACAVLGGAQLDTLLEHLLRCAMLPTAPKELFGGQAPLSSFSAKIDLTYSFALISEEERADLHLIRKIRNEFAHVLDHSLSFSSQHIANRISALRLPRFVYEEPVPERRMTPDTPRDRFQIGIAMLMYILSDIRASLVIRPAEPQSFRAIVTARFIESSRPGTGSE